MIDLYALTSPNVQKIFIMLEELGLPYKMIPVDVWKGEQYKPDFIKISPNSKIPVIVDHDGPGGKPYTVFESGAILMYLADKTGKFLPKDTVRRYDVIQWLMVQLTGVGPMFGQWTHFKLFARPGNEYSIVDIATFPWTRNHDNMGVKWESNPNLKRWFDAISARPAVQRGMTLLDEYRADNRATALDAATRDILFGDTQFRRR